MSEHWPKKKDRRAALKLLVKRLRRGGIPDVIANDRVVDDLLRVAYYTDEKEHWGEVEEEVRRLLNVRHDAPGSASPPGRGERGAPPEIAAKPAEETLRRAQVFAEVAAILADRHPGIKRFRRMHLSPSRLLNYEEAREFLDGRCGGPLPVRHGTKTVARMLWKLAEKLSNTYRWREGDAVWHVLTGYVPPVRPLEVRASISGAPNRASRPKTLIPGSSPLRYMAPQPNPRDYHPNTARITVTADAWVDAGEVERAFREARRQILGGDARALVERTLEIAEFVVQQVRGRDRRPSWRKLLESWNRTHPDKPYKSHNTLVKAFKSLAYREYNIPSYQRPERTPYQAYRDDWVKGRKGGMG